MHVKGLVILVCEERHSSNPKLAPIAAKSGTSAAVPFFCLLLHLLLLYEQSFLLSEDAEDLNRPLEVYSMQDLMANLMPWPADA